MRHPIPLREMKKTETRRAIIEAAERLFLERGYEITTLDDIAFEVMIHKKTILRYFSAKEEIALAYNRLVLEEFKEGLRGRDPGVSVLAYWRRHVERHAKEYVQRGDSSGLDSVIRGDPRLLAKSLAIDLEYEAVIFEALRDEGGAGDEIEDRLLAVFLVNGNRSVAAPLIEGNDLEHLPAQVLSVVDRASELFGYAKRPAVAALSTKN
jgi:AcrR family transcriptional regulator